MKTFVSDRSGSAAARLGRWMPVILAAGLLASCATGVERRISRYPQAFQALPEEHKALVMQRRITEGMSRDAVFFAWGPPHRVVSGSESGRSVEQWKYLAYDPQYRYNSHFGWGWGHSSYCPNYGYGFYDFGPDVYYVSRDAARVDFRNGQVSAWTREY